MTEQERDELLIRLDERMCNHLKHHELSDAKHTKWLIALTICLIGLIGKAIIAGAMAWLF